MFIEWIAASMPASSSAKTGSVPVDLIRSFFRTETITLPAVLRKNSPTPVGRSRGFQSNSIKRQDKKVSIVWVSIRSVHNFWTTFANALRRLLLDVLKLCEVRILRGPPAPIPEGSEFPLALIAFLIISSSIDWNLTGWILCKGPFNKRSFSILFVNNFHAGLMLPFVMYCVSFLNIFAIDDDFAWFLGRLKWFQLRIIILQIPLCAIFLSKIPVLADDLLTWNF